MFKRSQPKHLSLFSSKSNLMDSPQLMPSPIPPRDSPFTSRRKSKKFSSPPLFSKKTLTSQESNSWENNNNILSSNSQQSSHRYSKSNTMMADFPKTVQSHNNRILSTQKTVKFKSKLDDIEEDIGQDYLLGNTGKSLLKPTTPKNNNEKQHFRSKTEVDLKNNEENPYITNTPKDFIKTSYNYDPNFKKTFESFLEGEADIENLMNIKNFPSLYVFNPHDKSKLTYVHQKKPHNVKQSGTLTERRMTFTQRNDKKKESFIFTNKEKQITSPSKVEDQSKRKVLKHFDQIKEIIKNRLMLKKKIKKEAFFLNDWNVKFFQNFYSITKEYIEKIKKKDLLTVNVNKNYYEKDYPTAQRLMKDFTLMNYTKNPKSTTSRFIEDRDSIEKPKQVHQDYLRLNADSFLALLKKDVKEKLQKEKAKITVPHLSHFIKKNIPINPKLNESNKKRDSSIAHTEMRNSIITQNEISIEDKKLKNVPLTERRTTSTFTKRDQLLKDYINYQEDLDFFVKSNYLNETGLFLNEMSKLENFDDQYISRNVQNLKKDDNTFLRDLPSLKAKIKYENLNREYEEKKKRKISKKKDQNERYYEIKRNIYSENNNNDLHLHELSEDDTSLPSLTEATLDNLYRTSLDIQKKIIKNKDTGFAPRIRQFLKLKEISNSVEETNKQKLR